MNNHTRNPELDSLRVQRGETQKDVNYHILSHLSQVIDKNTSLKFLDLPCGSMLFLGYLQKLFPRSSFHGADIKKPAAINNTVRFIEMDLSKEFPLPGDEQFDVITSISGVMMFGNTLSFISNCSGRLVKNGTFIITNDNAATIKDKLSYLFLGHHRIFRLIYEDTEQLTQNIPIQELCRLLRTNGLSIERIDYVSFYKKDLIYLPFLLLLYPIQWIYLKNYRTGIPAGLKRQMFSFRHFFYKHYIIVARKL